MDSLVDDVAKELQARQDLSLGDASLYYGRDHRDPHVFGSYVVRGGYSGNVDIWEMSLLVKSD
jgi:hypothetical protein